MLINEIFTRDTNIISEDQTAGGSNDAGKDHISSHLSWVFIGTTVRRESTTGHQAHTQQRLITTEILKIDQTRENVKDNTKHMQEITLYIGRVKDKR